MSANNKTTIAVETDTRNRLFRLKNTPEDSYDDVIQSLIEE